MQDVTVRRLNFHDNPHNDFLTCAGHNFIVEDMISGDVHIWERTKDLVLRNSNCRTVIARYDKNIYKHGVYRINNIHCDEIRIYENAGRNIQAKVGVGIFYDSIFNAFGDYDSEYYRCTMAVSPDQNGFVSYLSMSTKMYKCVIKSVNGDKYRLSFNDAYHGSSFEFTECTFEGEMRLMDQNAFYDAKFTKCKFDNMYMKVSVCADADEKIEFIECDISYNGTASFIKYGPYNYTVGTYSDIAFTNCNITCTNMQTLVYGDAKPNIAMLLFDNCNLNMPEITEVFNCDRGYLTNIKDITIKFINTEIPCYNVAGGLEEYNIKIMEE